MCHCGLVVAVTHIHVTDCGPSCLGYTPKLSNRETNGKTNLTAFVIFSKTLNSC